MSVSHSSLRSRLVQGGLVVGAGILLGNITGFLRVAVTAWLLGTHTGADALAVAMGPLDTLNSVVVNTMLFAFVPMLVLRHGGDRTALFQTAGRVFAALLLAATLLVALLAPQLIAILGPGLAAPEQTEAAALLRLFAPATMFSGCAALFSALLYTNREFFVPGLYQTCLNTGTICGALMLRRVAGVRGFALGYTAGAALQLLLTWYFSRNLRSVESSGAHFSLREILTRPGMFMLYAALISGNLVVTRAFATHGRPGTAAAFDYCMRCFSVVLAYLVYPIASTLVPEIARLRGAQEILKAHGLIDRSVGLMLAAATAACGLAILLRTPVIALLFQRGNFTAESTRLVSAVFLGIVPSVVGWALIDLIARCFFALDRPKPPLAAAFIPIGLNLAITSALLAAGKLANPSFLGLGASVGLLAAFAALFAMSHTRRGAASFEPSLAESP